VYGMDKYSFWRNWNVRDDDAIKTKVPA